MCIFSVRTKGRSQGVAADDGVCAGPAARVTLEWTLQRLSYTLSGWRGSRAVARVAALPSAAQPVARALFSLAPTNPGNWIQLGFTR
jgi:hypothetical protein